MILPAVLTLGQPTLVSGQAKQAYEVRVVPNEAEHRVDILVDGKPFTAYIYPGGSLKKPVLYPLRSASGTIVTRGFPLEPRSGERVDHPHHVGLWFNYGNVNGIDFWNNSDAIPAKDAGKMGTILHRKIKSHKNGSGRGELEVVMEWVTATGKPILREDTEFIFRAGPDMRTIDRITTLTALDERVVFTDDKEGVIGMRVARQLEQPSDKPEVFTDSSGKATRVAVMNNAGVNGLYRSSEGRTGDQVWGTRGRWTTLTGKIGEEAVTLAILDHEGNPGYPTYWHARGYGLFAANPLGQKIFSNGKQELNFTLNPRQSATFRYRVLILSGTPTPDRIENEFRAFITSKE
jgi:hypothetical protein